MRRLVPQSVESSASPNEFFELARIIRPGMDRRTFEKGWQY